MKHTVTINIFPVLASIRMIVVNGMTIYALDSLEEDENENENLRILSANDSAVAIANGEITSFPSFSPDISI